MLSAGSTTFESGTSRLSFAVPFWRYTLSVLTYRPTTLVLLYAHFNAIGLRNGKAENNS